MRRADEAENDDTEQHPWGMARKEMAEGGKYLVKIGQSKHRVSLVNVDIAGKRTRCLLAFALSAMLSGHISTSPGKFENL